MKIIKPQPTEEHQEAINYEVGDVCPRHKKPAVHKEYGDPDSPLICLECEIQSVLNTVKEPIVQDRKYPLNTLQALILDTLKEGVEYGYSVNQIAGNLYDVVQALHNSNDWPRTEL